MFAPDVLVTVRVSEGTPSVRANPVVGAPTWATEATSFRKTGVGAAGGVGAVPGWVAGGEAAGAAGAAGGDAAGAPGGDAAGVAAGVPVPAVSTPTTRFSIWAIEVNEPIVETGMFVVGDLIWPDGRVRLLAARTPLTWATEIPVAVSLAGSRVTTTSCCRPPVTSTVATPSMPWRAGTISVFADLRRGPRPSWLVPATEAMITGEELMFSAETCGVTLPGSPASWRFCSIVSGPP